MQNHIQTLKAYLPLFLISVAMIGTYILFYFYPVSWEKLLLLNEELIAFEKIHPTLTPLFFMLVYIILALLSFPGIFILSLSAGYLFPQPWSTIYVVIASTIGATLIFMAVRAAVGRFFYQKNISMVKKMQHGFHENAAHYLLFLRLIPMFPFALVNIVGAYLNVPLTTFLWTTFVGMIPSVFIYTQAGRGLIEILTIQEPLSATHFLNPHLMFGLGGLAIFSILPIVFKYLKKTA